MKKVPFLILSDAPSGSTGLAKICRELAVRINNMPEFAVGTYGLGRTTSRSLPFYQALVPGLDNMRPPNLPEVWRDFSQNEKGIFFTIWNPGWLPWLAYPDNIPDATLKAFLKSSPFERWGYFPIDAEGPKGRLPMEIANTIKPFERKLAYTQWAADMIDRTLEQNKLWMGAKTPYLPHGIDAAVYYPRDREEARKRFIGIVTGGPNLYVDDKIFMIGCVATNSQRKDWSLVFKVCDELIQRGVNVGLWAHSDAFRKYWDLKALTIEYGMEGRIVPTNTNLTEDQMAWAYSACDVTIAPGLGEGFGYPIFESLACGTPCVAFDYAGAAEFLLPEYKIQPSGFFEEGFYDHRRPVSNVSDWADKIQILFEKKAVLPPELDWNNLWPRWQQWLLEGIKHDKKGQL